MIKCVQGLCSIDGNGEDALAEFASLTASIYEEFLDGFHDPATANTLVTAAFNAGIKLATEKGENPND